MANAKAMVEPERRTSSRRTVVFLASFLLLALWIVLDYENWASRAMLRVLVQELGEPRIINRLRHIIFGAKRQPDIFVIHYRDDDYRYIAEGGIGLQLG